MGRRVSVMAVAVALLAALPAGALAARHHKRTHHHHRPAARARVYKADGKLGEWRGTPTSLAGRTQISRGELIYTDYLYDDYGPDYDGAPNLPSFRSNLAPTDGDYRYPADPARYGYNAADLRELRIAATDTGLHALIALQTMKVADAAIATIGIDTDGSTATGAKEWPDGIGLHTPGVDRFITTWGTGGHVVDAGGHVTPVPVAANLDDNAIEVDVPWSALGDIGPNAKVYVITGLDAKGGGAYMRQSGATAVFNVGFRGDDDWPRLVDHWGEHTQSQALAAGDIARFAYPLDIAALRARRTIPYVVKPGYYNRIFRSKYDYGEGINLKKNNSDPGASTSGSADPMFLSRYQPYGLYIPKGYDPSKPTPLLLAGHSLDVNHNEYRDVSPNLLRQLGDERNSLIITPLARGIDTWYLDSGLFDVFEAWNDVKTNYNVDPDRTSITGYSMGGYFTYRLGLLMPDAFVRASVYVGPQIYSVWAYPLPPQTSPEWAVRSNTDLLVDNALDLPYEVVDGNADELVPISGVEHQVQSMVTAGDVVRFYDHATDDHFSFILADQWAHTRDWLGTGAIDRTPARVRYKRYPSMDFPKQGLVFDHAYWVHDIQVRNAAHEDDWGEIDATTFARGGTERRTEQTTSTYPAGSGLSPAVVLDQHLVPGEPLPQRNGFEAAFTNLSSVQLDTAAMGLDPSRTVEATLRGDGPITLHLAGAFPRGVRATVNGATASLTREAGGLAVGLTLSPGGAYVLSVVPR